MTLFTNTRFLAAYSGLLTVAFAAVVVFGIVALRNRTFGTITARRINIVEPDGTVRLTISNRADFPGAWNRGKEYPRPDRREAAGMLFMSDEGTEQGGFIWGAGQLPDGSIQNRVHLMGNDVPGNLPESRQPVRTNSRIVVGKTFVCSDSSFTRPGATP